MRDPGIILFVEVKGVSGKNKGIYGLLTVVHFVKIGSCTIFSDFFVGTIISRIVFHESYNKIHLLFEADSCMQYGLCLNWPEVV